MEKWALHGEVWRCIYLDAAHKLSGQFLIADNSAPSNNRSQSIKWEDNSKSFHMYKTTLFGAVEQVSESAECIVSCTHTMRWQKSCSTLRYETFDILCLKQSNCKRSKTSWDLEWLEESNTGQSGSHQNSNCVVSRACRPRCRTLYYKKGKLIVKKLHWQQWWKQEHCLLCM